MKKMFSLRHKKCHTCDTAVYAMRTLKVEDRIYHKRCFRCFHCDLVLHLGNFSSHEGQVYCKIHFIDLFLKPGLFDFSSEESSKASLITTTSPENFVRNDEKKLREQEKFCHTISSSSQTDPPLPSTKNILTPRRQLESAGDFIESDQLSLSNSASSTNECVISTTKDVVNESSENFQCNSEPTSKTEKNKKTQAWNSSTRPASKTMSSASYLQYEHHHHHHHQPQTHHHHLSHHHYPPAPKVSRTSQRRTVSATTFLEPSVTSPSRDSSFSYGSNTLKHISKNQLKSQPEKISMTQTLKADSVIINQQCNEWRQAETRPASKTVNSKTFSRSFSSQQEKCKACAKTVYSLEAMRVQGEVYHKRCFRCAHCSSVCKLNNFAMNEGTVYCKVHFKELFLNRGTYDFNTIGKNAPAMKMLRRATLSSIPSALHSMKIDADKKISSFNHTLDSPIITSSTGSSSTHTMNVNNDKENQASSSKPNNTIATRRKWLCEAFLNNKSSESAHVLINSARTENLPIPIVPTLHRNRRPPTPKKFEPQRTQHKLNSRNGKIENTFSSDGEYPPMADAEPLEPPLESPLESPLDSPLDSMSQYKLAERFKETLALTTNSFTVNALNEICALIPSGEGKVVNLLLKYLRDPRFCLADVPASIDASV